MSDGFVKKRPPKLKLNVTRDTQQACERAIPAIVNVPPTATADIAIINDIGATSYDPSGSSSCAGHLDSKVRVKVGDQDDILVSPDSLTVVQQLGRGQYGIVEKVYHKASDCHFAVKRVALKFGDDSERTRLLMDVDILVKTTECKNIIKFFGALIWEGDLWILMELMDCSLDKFYRIAHRKVDTPTLVATNKKVPSMKAPLGPCSHLNTTVQLGNCDLCNPIPEKVLGRIAADIVNALNYLYSIKVIHRDIKPSNILINQLGIIKLCDFGISGYLVNSIARTYEAGCRPYMAPERIDPPRDRTGYDIKSDVWSFGITMFEIATGRYPYHQARDFFEQLKSICTAEPPMLVRGRFTPIFEDFISQCLRKNYQDRPKYDAIIAHPFIVDNKDLDIKKFTEKVLANLNSS